MANEIQVTSSLVVVKNNLQYQSRPAAFVADMAGGKGPTPGALTADEYGTTVDLSQLTTPGLCRVANLDDDDSTAHLLVGVYDGASFFPLIELLPGESYVFRLWRHLGQEFTGTSTGTPSDANQLRLMGVGGEVTALVEAFER